jgi:RND family efflux transporter MFP subunit
MNTRRMKIIRIALPLAILVVAVIAAVAMVALKPDVETRPPEIKPPLVRTVIVRLQDKRLLVTSQGTVSPRTESALVPEVSGRIIWVSPSFVSGGFFEKGEVLLRIDSHDYEQAVIRARAEVANAKLRLAQEEAEVKVAHSEWDDLGRGEATPLTLREPQLENAKAAVAAAEANLETAERNLERTEIRAPYAGRVRQKNVDVGQFVTVGAPVGDIYAIDYAEIRLPLPDSDLAYLDLPLVYRGERANQKGPKVALRANFAGETHEWEGRIVRTEGEIDPQSRMVHAVARVANPYGRGKDPDRPPLAAGLFVEAEIEGYEAKDVVVLPRAALRGESQVLVVDEEYRLRFRDIDLLRVTREEIVVRDGLHEGERVCLSPLEAVTDGMKVRTADDDTKRAEGGQS